MKIITNNFKEQISKLGREIDFKFFLHTNDKIITEDGNFLMTQSNQHLIVEQFDDEEVDEIINANEINNVSIINCGKLLSTMMKEIDFEIKRDLRIGDVIGCQFGLKVNGEYEYVDYGKYMVYSKEYNEDTKSYSYVAFDRMLLTMKEVTDTTIFENRSVLIAIQNICSISGLQLYTDGKLHDDYPNLNNIINEGTFTDLKLTYRDVLNMICQVLGVSMIVENKYLKLKPLNNTIVDNFDERFLKDTNVSFGKHYGPINSIVLSRSEDNDNIYRRDDESIEKNGLCEFKIKDNPILLNDNRENYIEEIFEQLNGLDYYINDFSSTGITYLDWLDFYNVTVGDNTYKCLMLNDEIKISQGLEESIYTEEPEETVTDYTTSSKTDKEVSFIVDKQNGKIRSRVTKDELESTIEQTASSIGLSVQQFKNGEKVSSATILTQINNDESEVQINSDKISLASKTIEMTSENIAINSTNFKVDKDGNMTANNGEFNGKIISSEGTIGGCTIDNGGIYSGSGNNTAGVGLYGTRYALWAGGSINNTGNANFSVSHSGDVNLRDTGGQDYASSRIKIMNSSNSNNYAYWTTRQFYNQYGNSYANLQVGGDVSLLLSDGTNDSHIFSGGLAVNTNGSSDFSVISGVTFVRDGKYINWGPFSLKELKKNINKFDKDAIKLIENVDIYTYNYKEEDNNDKKHIGMIIGKEYKTPEEFMLNDKKGIDVYSTLSVCIKAIQEQQEQIDSLKEEIKKLKEDK